MVTQVVKQGSLHQKKKWYFAAFLNLLVLPGTGTLVLGKRRAGLIQLGLGLLGAILLTLCLKTMIGWTLEILSRFNKNYNPVGWYEGDVFYWGSSPKSIAFIDYFLAALNKGDIPSLLGISTITMLFVSLGIFIFVWIYSLISLIQKSKTISE
jgi:TM2 domain-containing membrane protein YozV